MQIKTSDIAQVRRKLMEKQDHKCAICHRPFTVRDGPVLDHDHDTGYIRGVLHASCNGAEGKIKVKALRSHKGVKAPTFLIELGEYLALHSTAQINLIHPSHKTEDQKRLQRNKKARLARLRKKRENEPTRTD